jgi:hypothetical protein
MESKQGFPYRFGYPCKPGQPHTAVQVVQCTNMWV